MSAPRDTGTGRGTTAELLARPIVPFTLSAAAVRAAPRGAVVGALAIAVSVLVGWALEIPALITVLPGLVAMVPLTATGILCAALALGLQRAPESRDGRRSLALVCAAAVALIGCAVLAEWALGRDLGVDRLLFPHTVAGPLASIPPGRPSPQTAWTLVLLGGALLLLDARWLEGNGAAARAGRALRRACTASGTLLPYFGLVGYAYGVRHLHDPTNVLAGMALHTSFTLTLLGLGIALARPERGIAARIVADDAGGLLLRRLLPTALLLPLVIGALDAWGASVGRFSPAVGTAGLVLAITLVFLVVLVTTGQAAAALDRARAVALVAVATANASLAATNEQLQEQAAELEMQNEELVRTGDALQQRSDEAEDARRLADEANRAKSRFLASMSHELRTPLNAIQGHVQLIELEIHGPLTDAQHAALARVGHAQRHLLGLIEGVLDFATLETGRVRYDLRDVDLAEVLDEVTSMVEPRLAAKALAFAEHLPDGPCAVRADRGRLAQVLLNLLDNAVKFTPSGGRVTVDAERPTDAPAVVQVHVRDTGIGIASDAQATIFDPFVQANRALSKPVDGVGLGLAISRDLARGMGGDLAAESTPGVGSTFTLTLLRA